MALKHLTEEQVRPGTLEKKDRWWLDHGWKGDMPQLTLRSGLPGMLIDGMRSLTSLYIGAKTGWTLGLGMGIAVILLENFALGSH